jgi:hypothetical protein
MLKLFTDGKIDFNKYQEMFNANYKGVQLLSNQKISTDTFTKTENVYTKMCNTYEKKLVSKEEFITVEGSIGKCLDGIESGTIQEDAYKKDIENVLKTLETINEENSNSK